MNKYYKVICGLLLSALIASSAQSTAQTGMQYFRKNDKRGVNVFETSKSDSTPFEGLKVKVGGNFTQDFQALSHHNNANPVIVGGINTNKLISIMPVLTWLWLT